jgi:hypothetical protein
LLLSFNFHIWPSNINIPFGKKRWDREVKRRKL